MMLEKIEFQCKLTTSRTNGSWPINIKLGQFLTQRCTRANYLKKCHGPIAWQLLKKTFGARFYFAEKSRSEFRNKLDKYVTTFKLDFLMMMMIGLEFFVSNWAVKIPEESLKIVIGGVLSDFIFFDLRV